MSGRSNDDPTTEVMKGISTQSQKPVKKGKSGRAGQSLFLAGAKILALPCRIIETRTRVTASGYLAHFAPSHTPRVSTAEHSLPPTLPQQYIRLRVLQFHVMDALSIEETNRVRVSLGMKPLPVPGAGPVFKEAESDSSGSDSDEASTLQTRQDQGYANWNKVQEEAKKKKQSQARKEAIKKARDRARKVEKLQGKGLGDEDDVDALDTKTWLLQQKKRQKKLDKERDRARRMEEELKEREDIAYTSKDLAGVKVAHELDDFDDGEQVLTLKDTTIDENEEEGDELENIDLREKEKLGERLNLKKKKPVYDPNNFDDDNENLLLQQYDEVIDGKKRKRFTLDAEGSTVEERESKKTVTGVAGRERISLDVLRDAAPISDYLEEKEATFKKPKKKKSKTTRQKVFDEDLDLPSVESNGTGAEGEAMEMDTGATLSEPKTTTSFIDDDDLQASLAAQRRNALKKRKKLTAEEIARKIREEASAPPEDNTGEREEGGLVIDETSEFVANLRPQEPEQTRRTSQPKADGRGKLSEPADEEGDGDEDGDVRMSYAEVDERSVSRSVEPEASKNPGLTDTGLEEDTKISQGLGATLHLLRQRGLVDRTDTGDLNAIHRERQRFLADKQAREAAAELKARQQRERDRASGKLDRMSAREREEYARWENKQRDQAESRQEAERFNRDYRPSVDLKYIDDHGRSMNQKEAFKHLSHQFHGKGSGKQKTEKRLKKIEDEKKKEAQSILGPGQATGMNNALGVAAKKNKQAGVRLG